MPNVIDYIYDLQGWGDTEALDINSITLILNTLFITPPKDIVEKVYTKYQPVKKDNLQDIIYELEKYRLDGSKLNSLIKDFSNDNKVNVDFIARILEENGMKRSDFLELLSAALGEEAKAKEIDITSLETGLSRISTMNDNFEQ